MSDSSDVRRAYDLASTAYAEKFLKELDEKPFDREILREFARMLGPERVVLDLGCGPGHTTAYLASLGLNSTGIDISPGMIEQAALHFPAVTFEVGDFVKLSRSDAHAAGMVAFYCIVHLRYDELLDAFREMHRLLTPGGVLLLAFHAGDEVIRATNFLGTSAELDFRFFDPAKVELELRAAGFESTEVRVRKPYSTEHPSQRCYIFAFKSAQ